MPAPVLVPQANGDLPSNVFVPPGEEDDSDDSDSDVEEDTLSNNNQTSVQVKLVDLGGHTAMV